MNKDNIIDKRTKEWYVDNVKVSPIGTLYISVKSKAANGVKNIEANVFGKSDKDTLAKGELICLAVNNYERLVSENKLLLEALKDIISFEDRGRAISQPRISETWYNKAKEAINKCNNQ